MCEECLLDALDDNKYPQVGLGSGTMMDLINQRKLPKIIAGKLLRKWYIVYGIQSEIKISNVFYNSWEPKSVSAPFHVSVSITDSKVIVCNSLVK